MYKIEENAQLRDKITFGVSADCDAFIEYDNIATLPTLKREGWLRDYVHIGEGSNMLFASHFHGAVLRSADRRHAIVKHADAHHDEYILTAANGCHMDSLIACACSEGLWGLENLSGIPGCVGGAVVQNIGAYGVELKDALVSVRVYDTIDDCFIDIPAEQCDFGYRWSIFKRPELAGRYIVAEAMFRLSTVPAPRLGYGALRAAVEKIVGEGTVTPSAIRQAVMEMRDSKLPDPAVVGSAGSFFKNPVMTAEQFQHVVETSRELWGDDTEVPHFDLPDGMVKVPAAWFIDRCGWKGRTEGGAAVWQKQPLVLVNATGLASADDILRLRDRIIDDIENKFGVRLHPEVAIVGECKQ